jgi:hypothetical protein
VIALNNGEEYIRSETMCQICAEGCDEKEDIFNFSEFDTSAASSSSDEEVGSNIGDMFDFEKKIKKNWLECDGNIETVFDCDEKSDNSDHSDYLSFSPDSGCSELDFNMFCNINSGHSFLDTYFNL